jgi:hypothetical protein
MFLNNGISFEPELECYLLLSLLFFMYNVIVMTDIAVPSALCNFHNIPKDSVCLAETCRERLQCQICVKKH